MLNGGVYMYYTNYGCQQGGYTYPYQQSGGNWGGVFAFILVIFILLVIISAGNFGSCSNNSNSCGYNNKCYCSC